MKPINWTVVAIIAAVIIGLLGGWGLTTIFTPKCPDIKSDTSYISGDSIPYAVLPKVFYVTKDTGSIKWKDSVRLIQDTPMSKTDSIEIFKKFFAENNGSITIINDTNIYLKGNYKITQNKLLSLECKYVWKKPTQVITNNITNPPTNQLYIGLGGGTEFIKPKVFYLPIGLLLKTKLDNIFNLQIDPINKIVIGSGYIKIRLKKGTP